MELLDEAKEPVFRIRITSETFVGDLVLVGAGQPPHREFDVAARQFAPGSTALI